MDDWDTVTKIGSKTGGGSSQRETVVRGKGALNQAQRAGTIVGTEKKFATGNAAVKSGTEGQRLTKIDRAEDIIPPPKNDANIGNAVRDRRGKEGYKYTQKTLAAAVNATVKDIQDLESGKGVKNQALINKVAQKLGLNPRTGLPLPGKE